MCEIWECCGVREERLLRKEGGGGCLRADHGMGSGTWRSAQHPGRPPDYIKGQIVLHKLYQRCRPYDFC